MSLQSSLGVQATNKTGEIAIITGFVCTAVVALDIFNLFDGVGIVKRVLHGIVPGVVGKDKFRPSKLPSTKPNGFSA